MATKNDVTGDSIKSKVSDDKYREGWDRIFGNKNKILNESLVGIAHDKKNNRTVKSK